jgi:hypothetical protein
VATFADDIAIMAVGGDVEDATIKLQRTANEISNWTSQRLIKRNGDNSIHVNFTNKQCHRIPILLNSKIIPHSQTAKYLGMTLDAKLRWKVQVKKKKKKREERVLKYKGMYWLMGRRLALSTYNKLVLYKQVLKPVWTYGIQLWGCKKPSNIAIIQRFQNKVLRNIVEAPWYVRNVDLHRGIHMEMVTAEIRWLAGRNEGRLLRHDSVQAIQLFDNRELLRRLKRTKPSELVP